MYQDKLKLPQTSKKMNSQHNNITDLRISDIISNVLDVKNIQQELIREQKEMHNVLNELYSLVFQMNEKVNTKFTKFTKFTEFSHAIDCINEDINERKQRELENNEEREHEYKRYLSEMEERKEREARKIREMEEARKMDEREKEKLEDIKRQFNILKSDIAAIMESKIVDSEYFGSENESKLETNPQKLSVDNNEKAENKLNNDSKNVEEIQDLESDEEKNDRLEFDELGLDASDILNNILRSPEMTKSTYDDNILEHIPCLDDSYGLASSSILNNSNSLDNAHTEDAKKQELDTVNNTDDANDIDDVQELTEINTSNEEVLPIVSKSLEKENKRLNLNGIKNNIDFANMLLSSMENNIMGDVEHLNRLNEMGRDKNLEQEEIDRNKDLNDEYNRMLNNSELFNEDSDAGHHNMSSEFTDEADAEDISLNIRTHMKKTSTNKKKVKEEQNAIENEELKTKKKTKVEKNKTEKKKKEKIKDRKL